MSYLFSIIIPVYKETAVIKKTISNLLQLTQNARTEIIVVDGDKNGTSIHTIGHPDIIKIIAPRGRARQMNKGASVAKGDILIFLHADTLLPDTALRDLQSADREAEWVGGAFELGIDSSKKFYRFIELAVKWRTRITHIPYGDQAIFMKKDYFFKIGGFPQIPLMEDVSFMQRVKNEGGKIIIIPMQVKTSARRWEKEGILYCTLRNWILVFLYYLGVSPNKLVKHYYR